MIDPYTEHLVALHEVPDQLPRRRGRKVHPSSVYRWAQRGVAGVRLEIVMVGAITYTSREAIARFMAASTAAHATDVSGDAVIDAGVADRALAPLT
jgi:hypothetical protein